MQRFRHALIAGLGLASLVGALIGPASAFADPLTSWTAGPGGILDDTYTGFIDVPSMNATVSTGGFTVAGCQNDAAAQGHLLGRSQRRHPLPDLLALIRRYHQDDRWAGHDSV